MDHYREYQCSACDYYFSHPIDRCPICSDQFFWLLVPHQNLLESERLGYIDQMKNLGGAGVTEEFLTYRNRLWLPYNFWEVDPGGELLARWSFIKEIKLYQHKKNSSDEDTETFRDAVFDTNPAINPQQYMDFQSQHAAPKQEPAAFLSDTPKAIPSPWQPAPAVVKAPAPQGAVVASVNDGAELTLADWLPPVLIFVFFMLLSLSFLVLRYYKNTQTPIAVSHIEAVYEYPILS